MQNETSTQQSLHYLHENASEQGEKSTKEIVIKQWIRSVYIVVKSWKTML